MALQGHCRRPGTQWQLLPPGEESPRGSHMTALAGVFKEHPHPTSPGRPPRCCISVQPPADSAFQSGFLGLSHGSHSVAVLWGGGGSGVPPSPSQAAQHRGNSMPPSCPAPLRAAHTALISGSALEITSVNESL